MLAVLMLAETATVQGGYIVRLFLRCRAHPGKFSLNYGVFGLDGLAEDANNYRHARSSN